MTIHNPDCPRSTFGSGYKGPPCFCGINLATRARKDLRDFKRELAEEREKTNPDEGLIEVLEDVISQYEDDNAIDLLERASLTWT